MNTFLFRRGVVAWLVMLVIGPAAARSADALPADAAGAAARLAESPRHGEWVDVPRGEGEAPLRTWVVYPERSDGAPVVLVIHEIYGLTDWVRGVADALAAAGFIAVAPDMLSGLGPDGGGTASLGDDVRATIRKLTADEQVARLNAARGYALKLPSATDKSGVVGFCWGGSASFLYATRQEGLDAAVVYYGTAPADADQLAAIDCPVLGLYGGDDARVTATVEPTAGAMAEHGKAYETHVYDGAGHGFLRQQTGRDGANRAAAEQAWARTLAFFRERLEVDGE